MGRVRLGGPVFGQPRTPGMWVEALKAAGYRAAFCPVLPDADDAEVKAYAGAARAADIVIAEVGAWSNPLSPDPETRSSALEKCKKGLLLAERIGARCCVNIAGSRGKKWDGPCRDDLTEETFEMVVATVREIIDEVRPRRSFYTLETMPWMFPDSADAYIRLLKAVDRPAFGVHLDPVNLVSSPRRYFRNADLIRECVRKLGPHIRSCHAKDIILRDTLTVHLDEVAPGLGGLDYSVFVREIAALDDEMPLMMEHLPDAGMYASAAAHIRAVAEREGVPL